MSAQSFVEVMEGERGGEPVLLYVPCVRAYPGWGCDTRQSEMARRVASVCDGAVMDPTSQCRFASLTIALALPHGRLQPQVTSMGVCLGEGPSGLCVSEAVGRIMPCESFGLRKGRNPRLQNQGRQGP